MFYSQYRKYWLVVVVVVVAVVVVVVVVVIVQTRAWVIVPHEIRCLAAVV